ncbi:hypothetical protein [Candidatus Parabeggiatoa sp. HSG14]|uniref:hypothetical protein n=1 Tax=Candidatus Parabeggiatoa sp. HSG14 TaxID=3055593 RepID=UPI0025A89501|nr:hypothetical protein [Thiotrichales bacterium HSG14]
MAIFLIAQTPRAGEDNHKFVIPPNLPISIKEVMEYFKTAIDQLKEKDLNEGCKPINTAIIYQSEGKDFAVSQKAEQVSDGSCLGKDYIAVSQKTEQKKGREGYEILMLVGFDVKQLPVKKHKEVRDKLKNYLSKEFATLVTQTIDWKESDGVHVKRDELIQWKQDNVFNGLNPFVKTKTSAVTQNDATERNLKSSFPKKKQPKTVKGWLIIVAMLIVIIGVASASKCTQDGQYQTINGIADKISPYEKYNRFLPKDCQVSDENKKALIEIRTLCDISTSNKIGSTEFFKELEETDCHDKLSNLSNEVYEETFLYFVTDSNRRKLADLELDKLFQDKPSLNRELVFSLVNIRRQLRKLHNKLFTPTKPYDDKVCLPFFTDDDAKITSDLVNKLGQIRDGSLTLASCLSSDECLQKYVQKLRQQKKDDEQRLQQQTLDNFIENWKAVFGSKNNKDSAKRELKKLDYSQLKQLVKSQDRPYMSHLVAFISENEDKKQIYKQLGFDEYYPFNKIKLRQVVDYRNALRKLEAALKGKPEPEQVYLPLFLNKDAVSIKYLASKLALDGKNTLKPYLEFKTPKEMVLNLIVLVSTTKWNVVETKKQKKARKELEKLFKCPKNSCNEVFKQLDEYLADSVKMSTLVAFIKDKEQIYKLLAEEHSFQNNKLKGIVAVRNALREFDPEQRAKVVYLPLFSNDDARIISALHDRLKKVEIVESDNLLDGLKQISDIAQQLDNKKFKPDFRKQVDVHLGDCLDSHSRMKCVSQQLEKFLINPNDLYHKIDKLITSIEAVK